jgi:hypothetical protein
MNMIEMLTIFTLLALAGGGMLLIYSLTTRHWPMYPPMEMPWQGQYDLKDDYGRSFDPREGYDEPEYQRYGPRYGDSRYGRPVYGPGYDYPGYSRPMYSPAYPPQVGMSPWAAGGLGVLGGGLLGYHLGQMAGEQQASEGQPAGQDQLVPADQGGYDPGLGDAGSFDGGGFADMGADFGGGDFGGSEW